MNKTIIIRELEKVYFTTIAIIHYALWRLINKSFDALCIRGIHVYNYNMGNCTWYNPYITATEDDRPI